MLEGGWRTTAKLPRRVVVELSPSEFEKLDRACGGVPVADLLRVIALRLAQEKPSEQLPAP
jgi:hypothetical protein